MQNDDFLCCDASLPLITCDIFRDELLLYNIDALAFNGLQAEFHRLANKELTAKSMILELSGGQQVILMVLLALYSPAPKIRFKNIFHALDPLRKAEVEKLLSSSSKHIVVE